MRSGASLIKWTLALCAAASLALGWASPAAYGWAGVQDLGALKKRLSDPEAGARRKAVQGLAKLATRDAFDLIVEEALGDLSPRVADEAQLQLGLAAGTKDLFEALDSKAGLRSRVELVRERAAEALGRIDGAVPVELFQRVLKDKEPRVRRAAARALERRAVKGAAGLDLGDKKAKASVLKSLAKVAAGDRDEAARAAGILALGALSGWEPSAEAPLVKALDVDADGALVRAASLAALGEKNSTEALGEALQDEAHGVAMVALGALEAQGDRDGMIAIARAIPEGELPPGRRARVDAFVTTLRSASGLATGAVQARWVRWAEGLAADWSWERGDKKSGKGKGERSPKEEDASTTFYGLRLASDRLVFLIDMSGSMWNEKGDGSRKTQVEEELAKTLRLLPKDAYFNLVPYANAPGPWEKKLVRATDKNVEKAIHWFERNSQRGRGDLWSALVPALEDPSVDTVVILSDGAPSGGIRWNVELMRTLLADENRLRGVVIHTVLFEASGFLKKSWKAISSDSRGGQQLID